MQRKDVARENRILSRERGRRRVENLVPISGTAKRGKLSAPCSGPLAWRSGERWGAGAALAPQQHLQRRLGKMDVEPPDGASTWVSSSSTIKRPLPG
jgi:hypothetical protein